jgi:hypothetical protein
LQATVREGLAHYNSVAVASAGTVDLGAQTGNFLIISGTTTITSFGTVSAGIWKVVRFSGALTLTHNGTSLILPGAANITTVAGDVACFLSEGSGNWRCVWYQAVDGRPAINTVLDSEFQILDNSDTTKIAQFQASGITAGQTRTFTLPDASTTIVGTDATQTLTNKTLTNPTLTSPVLNTGISGDAIADQTAMEAASTSSLVVTPVNMKYHPGVATYWCKVTFSGGTPSIAGASAAGGSLTDNGTGDTTVNFPLTFSSTATMCPVITVSNARAFARTTTMSTTGVKVVTENDANTAQDIDFFIAVFGDL